MKKLLALTLSGLGSVAAAQTPAVNLMPDGSRDMYIGLGASVQPRYEGADDTRTRALPLLQVEFSNGVFLSGMQAGWHLSQRPGLEYGPLIGVHPGRDERGTGGKIGGVSEGLSPPLVAGTDKSLSSNRLAGLGDIDAHLTAGGFVNWYLRPDLRFNNTLQYGAGGNGLVWEASLQKLVAGSLDSPHRVSLSLGFSAVNRHYNDTFFGVSKQSAIVTGLADYRPDAGVKDVFIGARWNWALSPSWIVTSSARVSRLSGDARKSPLVERASQFSISTGLAYRF